MINHVSKITNMEIRQKMFKNMYTVFILDLINKVIE